MHDDNDMSEENTYDRGNNNQVEHRASALPAGTYVPHAGALTGANQNL